MVNLSSGHVEYQIGFWSNGLMQTICFVFNVLVELIYPKLGMFSSRYKYLAYFIINFTSRQYK